MAREPEKGVVLINVLVILALTASVVYAMISLSDLAILRSQRFSAAGQALALISGGEASAIVALRRDVTDAPQTDNLREPWALVGQQEVPIAGGTFALQIADAQAKFNLNNLPQSGALGAQMLQRIVALLDLPADVGPRIAARLTQPQPLVRMADLVAEAGLTPDRSHPACAACHGVAQPHRYKHQHSARCLAWGHHRQSGSGAQPARHPQTARISHAARSCRRKCDPCSGCWLCLAVF